MLVRVILQGMVLGAGAVSAWMGGGIVGSKHDFTRDGYDEAEICLPCHTPHTDSAAAAPLWNHAPSATERYRLYGGTQGSPGPATLVCLSCHDGSTAVDAYGGMDGDVFIQDAGSVRSRIGAGSDLSGDHPVGIDYPDSHEDFNPMVQVEASGEVPLPQGKVECLSCHDVHNQYGGDHLLVKSNARSALCLTCHRK